MKDKTLDESLLALNEEVAQLIDNCHEWKELYEQTKELYDQTKRENIELMATVSKLQDELIASLKETRDLLESE
jgi:putative N-acetylmannosamine-6-phosphate epimerase